MTLSVRHRLKLSTIGRTNAHESLRSESSSEGPKLSTDLILFHRLIVIPWRPMFIGGRKESGVGVIDQAFSMGTPGCRASPSVMPHHLFSSPTVSLAFSLLFPRSLGLVYLTCSSTTTRQELER